MEEEMATMSERKVLELVPKPEGVTTTGNRWVYEKQRESGNFQI